MQAVWANALSVVSGEERFVVDELDCTSRNLSQCTDLDKCKINKNKPVQSQDLKKTVSGKLDSQVSNRHVVNGQIFKNAE